MNGWATAAVTSLLVGLDHFYASSTFIANNCKEKASMTKHARVHLSALAISALLGGALAWLLVMVGGIRTLHPLEGWQTSAATSFLLYWTILTFCVWMAYLTMFAPRK
jgi:hypothetical protein